MDGPYLAGFTLLTSPTRDRLGTELAEGRYLVAAICLVIGAVFIHNGIKGL